MFDNFLVSFWRKLAPSATSEPTPMSSPAGKDNEFAITRELETLPLKAPPLDPTLYDPNDEEKDFLARTVSTDEQEVIRRIMHVQKVSVWI